MVEVAIQLRLFLASTFCPTRTKDLHHYQILLTFLLSVVQKEFLGELRTISFMQWEVV